MPIDIDIEAIKTSMVEKLGGHKEALNNILALPKPAKIPVTPAESLPPPLRYPVGT